MLRVQDPVAVSLSLVGRIKSIACGKAHTLLVSEHGSAVFAMGDNTYGQLGFPTTQVKSSKTPLKLTFLYPSKFVNEVKCGFNSSFALVKAI